MTHTDVSASLNFPIREEEYVDLQHPRLPVVIALWLGHADLRSTNAYLHADMTIKERALARTTPPTSRAGRFRPTDKLLAFLEAL